jgi:tetratricopeptide (TPR) repeat protein
MIFDGADVGYEVVEGFIPPGKHGNILISSRNATMNRLSSPSSAYMEVVELHEDAAVELFVKSAKLGDLSPTEQGHVEEIVRELCCLALAVDQAASSIATRICRIDEYLNLYQRHRLRLMDDHMFKGSSNYGRAVYTTWDISFAELEHRASSSSSNSASYRVAILLLRIFSFFHFDGIREETFRRAAEATDDEWRPLDLDPNSPLSRLLERSENNTWDSFNFREGIRVLTQFSLIHSDGSTIYSMHRLVHQWMQDRLPKSSRSEMALLATFILAQSEDYGESAEDHAHCRALLVHLTTLSVHLKQLGLMTQLSVDTMRRMAQVYRQGGKSVDAEMLLHQAIRLLQGGNPDVTEQYIDLLSQLSRVVFDLGRLREAEVYGRQVLAWQREHRGMDHVDTYTALGNLAFTLHALGELSEAKQLEVQVLKWEKQHLGMNHPDTYLSMNNLACTLHDLGELGEAKELKIQVMEWQKVHLGMNHPDTYLAMGNLACTLYELDELCEAKALEEQVLDWRQKQLGPEHPDTILVMENLAYTSRKLGEVTEAEELLAQVEELRSITENSHSDTSTDSESVTSSPYGL